MTDMDVMKITLSMWIEPVMDLHNLIKWCYNAIKNRVAGREKPKNLQ